MQGDAADEALISGVCERALQEEGKLDVFFANVRIFGDKFHHLALFKLQGWDRNNESTRVHYFGIIHERHEGQFAVVRVRFTNEDK